MLRVLKPGGYFCYTDGCWADDDCTEDLLAAGFELLERLEITSNVLHALRKDNTRRTALFDAMKNRDLREEYKHWGGVVGYRAYNRFEAGQTRYFSHRLRKPAEPRVTRRSTRSSAASTSCPLGTSTPNVAASTPLELRNAAEPPLLARRRAADDV